MTTLPVRHNELELTTPVLLCGSDGHLNRQAVGWSRHPLHSCNLPPSLARKKKWNYWAVTSNDLLFSATIADVEILQLGRAYVFDRRTHRYIDKTVVRPPNTIAMPEGIAGDITIEHRDMRVALTDEGAGTHIRVKADDFGGTRLEADILVERPTDHETLNVVIPWSDVQFQFTSKQNTLPASGFVQLDGERLEFAAPAFGCLDYGRGVWPEHTVWNWGAASGIQGGRTVGLNLGGQWTDGTGMTENGICVDGRLTKISEDPPRSPTTMCGILEAYGALVSACVRAADEGCLFPPPIDGGLLASLPGRGTCGLAPGLILLHWHTIAPHIAVTTPHRLIGQRSGFYQSRRRSCVTRNCAVPCRP